MGEIEDEVNSLIQEIPKEFIYKPHKDITAYEISLILPLVADSNRNSVSETCRRIDKLPNEAKRHFV